MKKKCLFEKLNNDRGAAAVLALSVILVLTTLGLVALASGAANIGMSSKTTKWTDDFYRLDAKASDYERMIDVELVTAEQHARYYVMNRLDKVEPGDLAAINSGLFITEYDMVTTGAQAFFNDFYRADWTYYNDPNEFEYSVENYMNYPGNLAEISNWYADNAPAATAPYPINDVVNAYTSDITEYASELFDRVYFYMLSIRLERLVFNLPPAIKGDIVIKEISGAPVTADYGYIYVDTDYFSTNKFNDFSGVPSLVNPRDPDNIDDIRDQWNNMTPADNDIGIFIRANEASLLGSSLDDPKKVHVFMNVIRPDYDTVLKQIYTPIKGNPIWANAISAQGSIVFENVAGVGVGVEVEGDVYASGSGGISVKSNADVQIKGNVYTPGNLQITGSNAKLKVSSNTHSYTAKSKIYGNDLLFENYFKDEVDIDRKSFGNAVKNYTYSERGENGEMVFIFKDATDKGNVYCNDLIVGVEDQAPISSASMKVTGNVWTRDDIQMEAVNSTMEIGVVSATTPTFYVGLNEFSAVGDLNESSAVINNYPFDSLGVSDSKIILNSEFYIPGTAFHKFTDTSGNHRYYKSLESLASRYTQPDPIIGAYLYRNVYGGGSVTYYDGGDEFELFDPSTGNETNRRNAFADFVSSYNAVGGLKTNILTDRAKPTDAGIRVDGYVAELGLLQHTSAPESTVLYTNNPGVVAGGNILPNATDNTNKFGHFTVGTNQFLMEIFESKTKKLGTAASDGQFKNFVNEALWSSLSSSEIIKFDSSATLDIKNINEGIVYCKGNLTIVDSSSSSTNAFNGTIICTGNVTIHDGVAIKYNEDKILEKLTYNSDLRGFFETGSRGEKVADFTEYSTSSGTRIFPRRYKIKEWREVNGS